MGNCLTAFVMNPSKFYPLLNQIKYIIWILSIAPAFMPEQLMSL